MINSSRWRAMGIIIGPHLLIQPGDRLIEMVEMVEVQLTHRWVVGIEAALRRQP